ncbi:hypothetical protein [Psychroflexus torquis]|uniref:hypothetical protein n=1 Tax=Psychroflexus torquis TaxID=57029 RepID=UPI0000D5322E|nr:hypothetical protein [Psychroflexus torquis]
MQRSHTVILSDDQTSVRQKIKTKDFNMGIEDSCSESTLFSEQTGRKKAMITLKKEI